MLQAREIRDVLNQKMVIGKEYHLHDIYALFGLGPGPRPRMKLKRRIRAELHSAKNKGKVSNPEWGYHIRHYSI